VFLSVSVPETCEFVNVYGNSFAAASVSKSGSANHQLKHKATLPTSALAATSTLPASAYREPWSPVTHSLLSPSFRGVVRSLLLLQQRHAIPRLPTTILSYILNFLCPRVCVSFDLSTVFPSDVDKSSGFSLGGPVLLQFRRNEAKEEKMIVVKDQEKEKAKPPGGPEFQAQEEERQRVIKEKEAGGAKFKVQYTDRSGQIRSWTSTVPIAASSSLSSSPMPDFFSSQVTLKTVLLQQYVYTSKNFLQSMQGQSPNALKIEELKAFRLWFEHKLETLNKIDLTHGKEMLSMKGELQLVDQLLAKMQID